MAFTNSQISASRMGVDLKFYRYDSSAVDNGYKSADEPIIIDFANSFAISPDANSVFATGGKYKKRLVEFQDPLTGTATIETQITNVDLLNIIAGIDPTTGTNKITWSSDQNRKTLYWVVEGDSVGKTPDGEVVSEFITLHKVSVSQNYNPTYTGDGDPQSLSIELSMLTNEADEFMTIVRGDEDTTTP